MSSSYVEEWPTLATSFAGIIAAEPLTFDAGRRPRVVVADDHPTVLVRVCEMLQPACEVVARVSTGAAAIDAIKQMTPDLLVVDLMLPDLDGLAVCRRVKQIAPEIEVIIMTALDDQQVRTIALRDGAAAFLPKHRAAAMLARTIQQIFAHKSRV